MGFFNNWPFSNLHNLNLDWIIEQVKKLTVVSDQIWERVKPVPGGDPSTITAAQAYEHASTALNSAANVGAEGAKTKAKLNEHTDNHNNPHGVTPEQIGAEPKITLLEISKGGTGGFNPVTARASLGARADFTILPVSDGGTGSSTPAGARDALGITPAAIGAKPDFTVLPVAQGGTGAADYAGARQNLGIVLYQRYDTGSMELGAAANSAWIQFYVNGVKKCQIDLTADGNLLVNQKRVLTEN